MSFSKLILPLLLIVSLGLPAFADPAPVFLSQWGTQGGDVAVGPDGHTYVVDSNQCKVKVYGDAPVRTVSKTWASLKATYR
jgi:hypothetical protein